MTSLHETKSDQDINAVIEDESPIDVLLNAEPERYLDWRGWLLLALMLAIATWALLASINGKEAICE